MSRPGRVFSGKEAAEEVYGNRDDGGPEWAASSITAQVCYLKRRFRCAGIDLTLKTPFNKLGYVYGGMKQAGSPKVVLKRLGVQVGGKRSHPSTSQSGKRIVPPPPTGCSPTR